MCIVCAGSSTQHRRVYYVLCVHLNYESDLFFELFFVCVLYSHQYNHYTLRIMNEYFKHTTCTSIEETKTQNFYIYIDLLFLLRFAWSYIQLIEEIVYIIKQTHIYSIYTITQCSTIIIARVIEFISLSMP